MAQVTTLLTRAGLGFWILVIGICLIFGIWDLGFKNFGAWNFFQRLHYF